MVTAQRRTVWLLAMLALAGAAAVAGAQGSPAAEPAPRLVVFEDFTRVT